MAKIDQYNNICKAEFSEIKEMIKGIDDAIRGNGKEGLSTRIVKLESLSKVLIWLAIALSLPVIGLAVQAVAKHFN